MYCHIHHCHHHSCGCTNINGDLSSSLNLKEDLSNFLDILKDKVLDVAYDLNYNEMLSLINQQEVDIISMKADIVLLKSQVQSLTTEVNSLKNNTNEGVM